MCTQYCKKWRDLIIVGFVKNISYEPVINLPEIFEDIYHSQDSCTLVCAHLIHTVTYVALNVKNSQFTETFDSLYVQLRNK